jgi:hypothetical protein
VVAPSRLNGEGRREGALSRTVGFTIRRARPTGDGVRVLEQVDELLELSVVSVPANARTATLALKGGRLQLGGAADDAGREKALERDEDDPPRATSIWRSGSSPRVDHPTGKARGHTASRARHRPQRQPPRRRR